MRILVTGGDSVFARLAVDHLHPNFELRVVDTRFTTALLDGVETQLGDLRDETFLGKAINDVEAVLHFAPLSLTLETDLANLEHTLLGTYRLAKAAQKEDVARLVLGSSMSLFASAPQQWAIRESWRPRPQPTLPDLSVHLAECCLRELARESTTPTVCVRFGAPDATVVKVLQQAFVANIKGWRILHASDHSPTPAPAPTPQIASRPIKNVIIFGAGGPMAAVATQELAPHYRLRLSDVKPMAEIVAAGPRKDQHPGAPMAALLGAPHDEAVVDITNAEQVTAACAGMDAIINCTVIRHDVVGSFRVNASGAYNVMNAAVAHGIRRVVHTGPFQIGLPGPLGYRWDDYVVDDVPARPGHGMNTYLHTKYLGQEICRIFAEQYGLEVPSLFFCDFADFVNLRAPDAYVHPFTTTWTDTARAIRCALEVPSLPSPFEILHVNADLPHGVFPNDKAKRILGWQPQDPTESWWRQG